MVITFRRPTVDIYGTFKMFGTFVLAYAIFILFFRAGEINKSFPALVMSGVLPFFIKGFALIESLPSKKNIILSSGIQEIVVPYARRSPAISYHAVIAMLIWGTCMTYAFFF